MSLLFLQTQIVPNLFSDIELTSIEGTAALDSENLFAKEASYLSFGHSILVHLTLYFCNNGKDLLKKLMLLACIHTIFIFIYTRSNCKLLIVYIISFDRPMAELIFSSNVNDSMDICFCFLVKRNVKNLRYRPCGTCENNWGGRPDDSIALLDKWRIVTPIWQHPELWLTTNSLFIGFQAFL